MSNQNPLPTEPATTPAGKTVRLLMWMLVLLSAGLIMLGIWGAGDPRTMLRIVASAGLITLVGSFLAMARRH